MSKGKNKLILEFTEFNNMRMNSDSVPQSTHVDNPSLSLDGYSRFDSNVRSAINRLNTIYRDVNKTNTAFSLRSGSIIEKSDIKNIKILRIFPSNDIYYNVYFSFEIESQEYYGVIERIDSDNPKILSELFRDIKIQGGQEWVIRIKGNLIKSIKLWMRPKRSSHYILLKDIDSINSMGELVLIPNGSKIKVISSNNSEITFIYENEKFTIRGKNFIYFNYYFQEVESES